MKKWKCGICGNCFDNFHAQGFNHTIYCPLCYYKELYKRENKKVKKAIMLLNKYRNRKDNWGVMVYGIWRLCRNNKSIRRSSKMIEFCLGFIIGVFIVCCLVNSGND